MNATGSLFSQILSLFQRSDFARHVRELKAEHRAKGFSSWDQFVAMLFCQLAQARSLREITDGLKSCEGKLKHLGLAQEPKRSTLSYANAHRPWELYERLFHDLLAQCQAFSPKKKFRFKNKLLSLDSTTVELCASMFDWAHFRQTKGAVKLHLLLDHDGYLPVFGHVTDGKAGDVTVAQTLDFPKGSIVAMDRGYVDYDLFTRWTRQGVFFVTRLKSNADIARVESRPVPKGGNIRSDEIIRLQPLVAGRPDYEDLRRVVVWLEDKQEELVLLTNHFNLAAATIAAIYKERWQIELFFKLLKQQLKIKTFVGTSANAVRIQVWTALIAVLVIRYLQFRSHFRWAVSNLVALLRWNLFSYRHLWEWLDRPFDTPPEPSPDCQLTLDSIQL
ncbi:MAG TPA: IS4 family transposase [Candidatus Binatia bacterium]|nr:IS4 family transposase [Candidatus Binatia bacterium]